MATERKLKDPGEAALSAVEQALSLEGEERPAAAGPARDAAPRLPEAAGPRLPDVHEGDHLSESVRPADVTGAEPFETAVPFPVTLRPDDLRD